MLNFFATPRLKNRRLSTHDILTRSMLIMSALLVAYLAYCGVRFATLYSLAKSLSANVSTISEAGASAKFDNLERKFYSLTQELQSASEMAQDPWLAPVGSAPIIGADFQAAKTTLNETSNIAVAAKPLLVALSKNKIFSGTVSTSFAMTDSHLAAKLETLRVATDKAQTAMDSIKTSELHFGLASKITSANTTLSQLSAGIKGITPFVAVFEPILTKHKDQTWFIATQNLAEARGTGGILGSFAVLSIKNGKVSLDQAGSDQDLDKIGAVRFNALPADLQVLWGGTPSDWRDMNVSAHVPYLGQQIYDSLKRYKRIDGVVVVGQGTVAHLVAAVGSFEISGVHVDGQNISDFLAKGIYARFESVAEKNKWVADFMHALFSRIKAKNFDYPSAWRSLASTTSGDRISAWAHSAELESRFEADSVAGEVSDSMGSTVQVTVNNAGGNKLDAYLSMSASYRLGECQTVTDLGIIGRKASLTLALANTAPRRGLPKYVTPRSDLFAGQTHRVGANRSLFSIYAPVDSTIDYFTLDGQTVFAVQGFDHKHPVWVFDISIDPGETRKLVAHWVEPTETFWGDDIQTMPKLIPPVALNPVATSVSTSGKCSVG